MSYMVLIPADSNKPCRSIPMNRDDKLQHMQNLVDGYIETVPCGNHLLIVNEEGKFNGSRINRRATDLIDREDFIFGDALLATVGTVDGETDIVGFDDKELADDFADSINRFLGKEKGAPNAATSEAPKA